MKFWIARDNDNQLYCYYNMPMKMEDCFVGAQSAILAMTLFPDVTFENSPQLVEIKLLKEFVEYE